VLFSVRPLPLPFWLTLLMLVPPSVITRQRTEPVLKPKKAALMPSCWEIDAHVLSDELLSLDLRAAGR
jgi:hypothetical protein